MCSRPPVGGEALTSYRSRFFRLFRAFNRGHKLIFDVFYRTATSHQPRRQIPFQGSKRVHQTASPFAVNFPVNFQVAAPMQSRCHQELLDKYIKSRITTCSSW